jgi:hypothetical protein
VHVDAEGAPVDLRGPGLDQFLNDCSSPPDWIWFSSAIIAFIVSGAAW